MSESIVLDEAAILLLQTSDAISSEWIESFDVGPNSSGLRTVDVGNVTYVLSKHARRESRLAVFRVGGRELFDTLESRDDRVEAFRRAMRGVLRIFDPSIAIPPSWKPYHKPGLYFSFQSNSYSSGVRTRLHIDHRAKNSRHVYIYYLGGPDPSKEDPDNGHEVFERAVASFAVALTARPREIAEPKQANGSVLDLTTRVDTEVTKGLSTEQWYTSKLNRQQRNFIDLPENRPVRLQGAAGTGKTLAMVIKCMKMLYRAEDEGRGKRIAYLTHSLTTADLVRNMLTSFDERGLLASAQDKVVLTITTLQSLATNALAYDLGGLSVLSDDGLEGRKLQIELIESLVASYEKGDWVAAKGQCSDPFRRYFEQEQGSAPRKYFAYQLMNEFACVLDADGVRDNAEKRAKYIRQERPKWMMPLATEAERQVVLDLYTRFRKELRDMKAIGVDQIIADYARYLDGFQWDTIRNDRGFDAIFVDELHLFNRQERMLFHALAREPNAMPAVFMAYDVKQSPRDTFLGVSAGDAEKYNFWKEARLANAEKIELQEVFRYTPQIAAVLQAIDQSFPALGMDEDWPAYGASSQIDDGPQPWIFEAKDTRQIYDVSFQRATQWARKIGKGRRVGVLCCNYENFETYLGAGQHAGAFVAVRSREDLAEISHAGKRFVLSMPEFVAGLQFEVVLLLDTNNWEVPETEATPGAVRQFVSQLYLGASRAEQVLELYASRERGGISRFLSNACASQGGALARKVVSELTRI